MATAIKEKPKANKKATAKKQTEADAALKKQIDDMFPGVFTELEAVLEEVKAVGPRLEELSKDVKAARTEVKETKKLVNSELQILEPEDEVEEPFEGGRIKQTLRWGINLLPQGRRERGQFMAGVVVGSTGSIFAPVAIVAASISRGRVIISS